MSPFDTPGQFVFVVILVTTTLTITLISSRLRTIRDDSRPPDEGKTSNDFKRTRFNHARWGVHQLDWLAFLQLILIPFALARIVWSAFDEVSLWYDRVLVSGAFLIMGPLWLYIFYRLTPLKGLLEEYPQH